MSPRVALALLGCSLSACVDTFVLPGQTDPFMQAGLPSVPGLTNLSARARGDSVTFDFDPVENARDYRVFVLPPAVSVDASGYASVENGTYRCAGVRAAPRVATEGETLAASEA